jgi:hypothetical protein
LVGQRVIKAESRTIQIIGRALLINSVNFNDIHVDSNRSILLIVVDVIGKKLKFFNN